MSGELFSDRTRSLPTERLDRRGLRGLIALDEHPQRNDEFIDGLAIDVIAQIARLDGLAHIAALGVGDASHAALRHGLAKESRGPRAAGFRTSRRFRA